jgi:hypothetical protein
MFVNSLLLLDTALSRENEERCVNNQAKKTTKRQKNRRPEKINKNKRNRIDSDGRQHQQQQQQQQQHINDTSTKHEHARFERTKQPSSENAK